MTPQTGSDLNGARGTVLAWDATAQRYSVEVAPPFSGKVAVKPANLKIAKLRSDDEYDGRR